MKKCCRKEVIQALCKERARTWEANAADVRRVRACSINLEETILKEVKRFTRSNASQRTRIWIRVNRLTSYDDCS